MVIPCSRSAARPSSKLFSPAPITARSTPAMANGGCWASLSVRLHEDGKTVVGRGADTDTLVASARAYIGALNRLIIKRERVNPDLINN